MKAKSFFIFLSVLSLLASCHQIDVTDPCEGTDDSIRGSGNLIAESRTLSHFNSVEMTTAGNVFITYGTDQAASVTVDDNLVEYIITSVRDEKLVIGIKPGVSLSNMNLTINLTMTDLEELITSSAGTIAGKNKFEADNVNLVLCSAGKIQIELEADKLWSILSSAGALYLSGSVVEHRAVVSSAGNLHAFGLITDTTRITLSSIGNAEVYATQLLDATISSLGSLYYKGHPTIYKIISSQGRVIDANP